MNNIFNMGNDIRNDFNFIPHKKEEIDEPSINEIIEKAVEYSKEHSGSRLIQKKYEECSEEERDKIFNKLQPEILSLSKDVFGNYAIQKILDFKDYEKNRIIFNSLKEKFYDLSLHMKK